MATSRILLFVVALYPCGALASLLLPTLMRPLARRLDEKPEDPRVAGAWFAIAVGAIGMVLSIVVAASASRSEVLTLGVGPYGVAIDTIGPIGCAMVSLLAVVAGIAMLPQLEGQAPPHAALLLAAGAGVACVVARDVRQSLLLLELAGIALALTLLYGADRAECRRAAIRFALAWQPGLALIAVGILGACASAHTYELAGIKEAIALDVAGNTMRLRWITAGAVTLLVLPAMPFAVPDVLSRRPLGSSVGIYGIGAVAASWTFVRLAFIAFPISEAWEPARRGLVIPAIVLVSLGCILAACLVRGPSRMVSLGLAGQGVWGLLAFAAGRPAFETGLLLCLAIPLTRAALLAAAAAGREVTGRAPEESMRRLHLAAVGCVALAYVAGSVWVVAQFHGWWRLLAAVLITTPAIVFVLRVGRFCLAERVRKGRIYAVLAAATAAVAVIAAVPQPMTRALVGRAERELGVHVRFHRTPLPAPEAGSTGVRQGPPRGAQSR